MLPLRRVLVAVAALAPVVALVGSSPASVRSPETRVAGYDGVRVRAAAPIVVNAQRTAQVGRSIRLVGDVVVAGSKPRAVRLAESRNGHWKVVARTTSKRTGVFTFGVPAGRKAGTRVFRAQAGAARGLPAVHSRTVKVRVTAKAGTTGPTIPAGADYDAAEGLPNGYDPPGSAKDWSSLFGAQSVRWDPCTVIRWRYNDQGQAYDALPDVTRAIAKIAGVSGLRFKYVGTSTFRYLGQKSPTFPDNAALFVSWASAAEYSAPQGQGLDGSVVGVGGGYATSAGAGALGVDWRMADGYLTLDKGAAQVAPGFDGSGWGQIMMHETLHAMGLGHAQDTRDDQDRPTSREVMAPVATDLNFRFGAGDITGMHRVGLRSSDDCA